MAYYCTRCEADDHPELSKSEMRDLSDGFHDEQTMIETLCDGCHSNTYHVYGPVAN